MLHQLVTGKNMCIILEEVVDFNVVAFCLKHQKSLLLTICIKQIPHFETSIILNHLSIQQF